MPPTNKADLTNAMHRTRALKEQLDAAAGAAQRLLNQQECLYEILDAKERGRGQSDKAKDYSEPKYNSAEQQLFTVLKELQSAAPP